VSLATVVDSIGDIAAVIAAVAAAISVWFAWKSAVAGKDAAEAARETVHNLELARRDAALNTVAIHLRDALERFQRWANDAEEFHMRMAKAFTNNGCPAPSDTPQIDEELSGLSQRFRELDLGIVIRDIDDWHQDLLVGDEIVDAIRIAEATASRVWSGFSRLLGNFTSKPSRETSIAAIVSLSKRRSDPNPWSLRYIAGFSGDLATAVSRTQKRVASSEPRLVRPDDGRNVHWLAVSDSGTWVLHSLYKDRALAGFTKP
jgi:hypothetical protein